MLYVSYIFKKLKEKIKRKEKKKKQKSGEKLLVMPLQLGIPEAPSLKYVLS